MVSPLCFQKAQSFCNYFLHVCSKELLSFAYFQLLTDNVSYSLGNAGKKKDLSSEEQATFTRPLHSLGGCIVVWCLVCSSLRCCLTWCFMSRILRHLHPFVADRRGTAPTGDVEPCSILTILFCTGFVLLIPPLAVHAGSDQHGHRQGPIQKLKRGCLPPAQDTPFSTIARKKVKARTRARIRVAIKAKAKGKVMIGKVDRTRSPPFRLVLGQVFNLLLILYFWHALASARRHLGRSGGF